MQYGRLLRHTTEQGPRIQADPLDAPLQQQAVERPLLTLGEESRMTHLDGQCAAAPVLDKGAQFSETRRAEAGGQLQPEWRHPRTQGCQQAAEVVTGGQLLAQIPGMADIARQLGAEAQVRGHQRSPAANRSGRWSRIEGGVALDRIEDLGVARQKLRRTRAIRIQRTTPGRLAPGRATEKVGTHQWS